MRIAFTTLGCKINQFETDALQREFLSRGSAIVPFDAEADVYIINTCSVTEKSDYQSRRVIRSAIRRGNGAKVVVTGCYAATQPEEIKKIPGVGVVIGNREKTMIPELLMPTFRGQGSHPALALARPAFAQALISAGCRLVNAGCKLVGGQGLGKALHTKTRGFLKIQDGCDNQCSYCIVPIARGGSRSAAPREVMHAFERLVEDGCPEVVLTGIHIGAYGSDLKQSTTITEMLKALIPSRGRTRIRLSSIEPNEITKEMIGFLGQGLCRHLHVPLQSGDDAILGSMKRNYTSRFYLELLETIAKQVPGTALGADVMVGFPGEGEKEFQSTMRLVEQSPLSHLHVFCYSPRPGTSAAGMRNQVPEPIKKERREALRTLGMKKNLSFRKMHLKSELKVVVEDKINPDTGLLTGLTDNYIRVHIDGAKTEHIGKEVKICVKDVKEQGNFGSLL